MNVLHVNNVDLLGNRFNGYDMQVALNAQGITANQVVMERMSDDPHTFALANSFNEPFMRNRITECERGTSLHAMLYPYLFKLMDMDIFKKADVVHYHLLHNYFGALPIIPEITRRKPSVLTIHDPWVFTGHCIHPFQCEGWKTGCNLCTNLNTYFNLQENRAALQWAVKKSVFSKANIDLVVASQFMMDFIRNSPITSHIERVHLIPFGIDLNVFSADRSKSEIRKKLSIPEENFAMCFRADPGEYKGFDCIQEMLEKLRPARPVTLIAVGNQGALANFNDRYQILDYGWITDNNLMAELYCASDVFLMPSTAESFGMMAIETMASSRPIIVCDGTALPSITFAPECGISIPQKDSDEMCKAVIRLMNNPNECHARGELGRKLAEKHYRFEDYVARHLKLYEELIHNR